jgi:hypothetical protein
MKFFQLSSKKWINLAQITYATKDKDGAINFWLSDGSSFTEQELNFAGLLEEAIKANEFEPT